MFEERSGKGELINEAVLEVSIELRWHDGMATGETGSTNMGSSRLRLPRLVALVCLAFHAFVPSVKFLRTRTCHFDNLNNHRTINFPLAVDIISVERRLPRTLLSYWLCPWRCFRHDMLGMRIILRPVTRLPPN